jgi:pantoate--beta-alanine ligase
VRDLDFPVEIIGVPTVREEDGLAFSSRNRRLSPPERNTALALSRALFAARDRLTAEGALCARAAATPRHPSRAAALAALDEPRASADAHALALAAGGPSAALAAARHVLDEAAKSGDLDVDYLALVDPDDLTEISGSPDTYQGEAILAVAARVGTTRLIDNIRLTFGAAS